MKTIRLVLTLAALLFAGAGVFATSSSSLVIDQRIDSNDADSICDQPVTSQCNVTSGRDCSYNDNGTMKSVHDYNANCQLLFRP